MQKIKRAVAIEDISCFGKCALTIALPVLSAAGVETSVLPTALLSAHTGGLGQVLRKELTEEMQGIIAHWERLNPLFDGICSGYLANGEQVDIVCNLIDKFKIEETLILVDPAMADNGKMYAGFQADFAEKMLQLCCKAHVITPNLTEAAMLLKTDVDPADIDREEAAEMARELAEKTGASVVLTGLDFGGDSIEILACENGRICRHSTPKIRGHFHGTGDLFASVIFAACLNGVPLEKAAKIAAEFTYECVAATANKSEDHRFGLCFEGELARLNELIKI